MGKILSQKLNCLFCLEVVFELPEERLAWNGTVDHMLNTMTASQIDLHGENTNMLLLHMQVLSKLQNFFTKITKMHCVLITNR